MLVGRKYQGNFPSGGIAPYNRAEAIPIYFFAGVPSLDSASLAANR